jgi:DNA-binding response OmpR family regulator
MNRTVLLIEDEVAIAEAIAFLLESEGLTVLRHADGGTALDQVRSHVPDLIILDVMLPNRTGYDIVADIRAEPALAGIPVLMLTARGQTRDRQAALDAGATRFMTKPFANREILSSALELLSRNSAR